MPLTSSLTKKARRRVFCAYVMFFGQLWKACKEMKALKEKRGGENSRN
jgi:hypothetical protein